MELSHLKELKTMKSQFLQNPPVTYRAKTAHVYTGLAVLVAVIVLVALAIKGGPQALLTRGWAVLFVAYAVWYLLGRPCIVVDRDEVTVMNPFATHRVGYAALVDVSTRYHLTLVTPTRSIQAFGLPAGGMVASLTAHRQELRNLPAITYGAEKTLRPSDLPNSSAGAVALVLRGYWQELVEAGALEGSEPTQTVDADVRGIALFALLACAAVVGLTI